MVSQTNTFTFIQKAGGSFQALSIIINLSTETTAAKSPHKIGVPMIVNQFCLYSRNRKNVQLNLKLEAGYCSFIGHYAL